MNVVPAPLRPSNPFATRFVRPGAIAYRFAAGDSAEALVARLRAAQWRGQVIGPHGSGKSTLLASLARPLVGAGRTTWSVGLHDGQRRMPRGWTRAAAAAGADLVIVDGFEQLARVSRAVVRLQCRHRRWGLLVTAHADVGLPTLVQTSVDLDTARSIVAELLGGHELRLPADEVAASLAAAGGNLREALFRLYDRWEALAR